MMKAFLFLVAVLVCAWLLICITSAQAWIIQTIFAFAFPDFPWTVAQVWAVLMVWCVFYCPLWLRKIWAVVSVKVDSVLADIAKQDTSKGAK